MKSLLSSTGKFLLQTKLFWGLAVLYLVGVFSSPINHKGGVCLMLGEHILKRLVHDCELGRRQIALAPSRRVTGGEQQHILLA